MCPAAGSAGSGRDDAEARAAACADADRGVGQDEGAASGEQAAHALEELLVHADPVDEVALEPMDEYLVNARSSVLVARAPAGGE